MPRSTITAALALSLVAAAVPASGSTQSMPTDNQPADQAHPVSPQVLADLGAINDRFIENFIRNDVASHDALLHPRFVAINADGSRIDRATYLKRWATGFDPAVIPYWDVRDEVITVIGNVALVRSTNRQVVRRGGKDVVSMTTYTDTYIYSAGRWWCIQAQTTVVARRNWPADSTIKTVYLRGIKQV